MDFATCPSCSAPAVLLTDTLAICSADACSWSHIVTLQQGRGAGMWYEHAAAGRGWGRRWCTAEAVC